MRRGNLRAASVLVRALEDIPAQAAHVVEASDGAVVVRHGSQLTTLRPLWVGEGFPRDVADHVRTDAQVDTHVVHVARAFSPGALDILTRARASWADETGRMFIAAPGLFVERRLADPSAPPARRARSISWSPGARILAEVILHSTTGTWQPGGTRRLPRVRDLAEQAGITSGYASRVLTDFDTTGWTAKVGGAQGPTSGRELRDPGAMLDAWAHAPARDNGLRAHTLVTDPLLLVERTIAPAWPAGTWMTTGWAGLDERAPWATSTPRTDLYLDEHLYADRLALTRLLEEAALTEVDSGERVTVRPAPAAALRLATREGRVPVASDVRLYADLLRTGGVRGTDAAEHLRTTRIGF